MGDSRPWAFSPSHHFLLSLSLLLFFPSCVSSSLLSFSSLSPHPPSPCPSRGRGSMTISRLPYALELGAADTPALLRYVSSSIACQSSLSIMGISEPFYPSIFFLFSFGSLSRLSSRLWSFRRISLVTSFVVEMKSMSTSLLFR